MVTIICSSHHHIWGDRTLTCSYWQSNYTTASGINLVIDISRHSKLTKLHRVTTYVLRFIINAKIPSQKMAVPFDWSIDCHRTSQGTKVVDQSCSTRSICLKFTELKSKTTTRLPLLRQLHLFFTMVILFVWGQDTQCPCFRLNEVSISTSS